MAVIWPITNTWDCIKEKLEREKIKNIPMLTQQNYSDFEKNQSTNVLQTGQFNIKKIVPNYSLSNGC
jgi:hypothetical protein